MLGMGPTVTRNPKDDFGTGANVKMQNREVESGQQMYEGRSQAQGLKDRAPAAAQEQIGDVQHYALDLFCDL